MADTTRICRYCGSGSVIVAESAAHDGSITIQCHRCLNSYVETPIPSPVTQPTAKPVSVPQKQVEQDAKRKREADELFREGMSLIDQRKFDTAALKLRAASDKSPKRMDIISALANASSRANMQYEALAAYNRMLEIDPENREALLKAGMLHIQRKRYDLGEAALRKLILLDPNAEQAKLLLDIAKAQEAEEGKKAAAERVVTKAEPMFLETVFRLAVESDKKSRLMASLWIAILPIFFAARYFAGPESAYAEWVIYAMLICAVWMGVVVHELGHGFAALWLGDDTALRSGRLTLNPFSHFSLIGGLVAPVAAWITAGVPVGWAKPVQFDPLKQKRQPRDIALTAMAGPFTNFAFSYLMFTLFMALAALHNTHHPEAYIRFSSDLSRPLAVGGGAITEPLWFTAMEFTALCVVVNLLIGVFNLLPIPPLDGGWLLKAVVPKTATGLIDRYGIAGVAVVLAVAFSGLAVAVFYPAFVAAVFYHFVSGITL